MNMRRMVSSKAAICTFFCICLAFYMASGVVSPQLSEAASGPVTAKAAYDMAVAMAMKWQPDAKLCNFTTIATGPVDVDGRSSEWSIHFSSKKAGKVLMVTVSKGAASKFEVPGPGGRIIEVTAKTNFDSKQLIAKADAAGGAAHRKKGALVSLGLVQSPVAGVGPLWHISYAAKGPDGMPGKELFHVAIEGNTGKLSVL